MKGSAMRSLRLLLLTLFALLLLVGAGAKAMGERVRTTDIPGTVNVTTRNFESEVLEHDGPILVFFTADWCPYCQRTVPSIKTVAEMFAGDLKVVTIDYDKNPKLVEGMKVRGIPALYIIRDGKAVAQTAGYHSADRLRRFVLNNMGVR